MNPSMTREERLAAALAHLGAFIPVFGLSVPLVIGLAQNERTQLRFQALQAAAYQGIGLALYILIYVFQMLCGLVMTLGMLIGIILANDIAASHSSTLSEGVGVALIVIFIFCMLLMWGLSLVQALGAPVFMLIAAWAAGRILQQDDFHYPILGGMIARRLHIE